ncbi:MAG: rod shape-determining protein MreC [Endomicrobia bacterium]|nr:rod shape-determining protein MreC [Endomicrobiia bacterium]MDW8055476.1 rod shape-determining protein MreC [Elusimicrobiota bacterium]
MNYPLVVVNRFVKIPFLYEENLKLKKVVKDMYILKLQNEHLIRQIDELSTYKGLSAIPQYRFINCEIVTREYKEWFNECIVNIDGDSELVTDDSPVIAYLAPDKFFFVGRIWSKRGNIAKVLLVTNTLSMIPVRIKNKNTHGILIGSSSPILYIDYILLEDDIRIGDTVVTFGINNLPEGVEIGRVENILGISDTGFKKVSVKLGYNINSIKNLLILVRQ